MKKIQLIISILFISNYSIAQNKNFIDQSYLETTAKVDTLITPDIIFLNILINEKDERNRISVEELEGKMMNALTVLGIDLKKQLSLTDLSSNFKTYFLKRKDIMKSKAYNLKVYDATTAGKAMAELEDVGISNVTLDKTEYSKMEELKLELKSLAVAKAKKQADYLVKPLNQKITRALFIADKYYQEYDNRYGQLDAVVVMAYSNAPVKEEAVEIEFKSIKVEAEVTVKFGME
jgi:uncharacterized protein YggE